MAGTGRANIYASFHIENLHASSKKNVLQTKSIKVNHTKNNDLKRQTERQRKKKKEKGKGNGNESRVLGFLPHSLLLSDKPLMF